MTAVTICLLTSQVEIHLIYFPIKMHTIVIQYTDRNMWKNKAQKTEAAKFAKDKIRVTVTTSGHGCIKDIVFIVCLLVSKYIDGNADVVS